MNSREKALVPLVAAIVGDGPAAAAAARALRRFPPLEFTVFLRGKLKPAPALVRFLGTLGDARAIPFLRHHLGKDDASLADGVALALARLQDGAALAPALHAARLKGSEALAQRRAAAEILVRLRRPEARPLIVGMLSKPRQRSVALRLLRLDPQPRYALALRKLAASPSASSALRSESVELLAQMPSTEGLVALAQLSSNASTASSAVLALARHRSPVAEQLLERMLRGTPTGEARRLVLRACLARWLALRQLVPGLRGALVKLQASPLAADRSLVAYGRVVLGGVGAERLLSSNDLPVRYAVARALLAMGPASWKKLRPLLGAFSGGKSEQKPSRDAVLGAAALLYPQPQIAARQLLHWAESESLLAPMAAFRLAARDPRPFRRRLLGLLSASDGRLRRHIVLGLSQSPEADASGILLQLLREQADPRMRQVALRGLMLRGTKPRAKELRRLRLWDPAVDIRRLAATASSSWPIKRVPVPQTGSDVLLLRLISAAPTSGKASIVAVERPDGLMLPVAAAPDGVVLLGGLAEASRLRLQFPR